MLPCGNNSSWGFLSSSLFCFLLFFLFVWLFFRVFELCRIVVKFIYLVNILLVYYGFQLCVFMVFALCVWCVPVCFVCFLCILIFFCFICFSVVLFCGMLVFQWEIRKKAWIWVGWEMGSTWEELGKRKWWSEYIVWRNNTFSVKIILREERKW